MQIPFKPMNSEVIKTTPDIAETLCRGITQDLPEYFGLPECNEHYALGVRDKVNLVVQVEKRPVGLLSLEFPYPKNTNIYWMGILKQFHHQGLGKLLIQAAVDRAIRHGASTMTVETLAPSEADENYLQTYQFYEHMGFRPLFNLKPEGYVWNMVYMCRVID